MRLLDFTMIAALLGRDADFRLNYQDVGGDSPLVTAGFLVPDGLAAVIGCPCGEGHTAEVEREVSADGGTKYYASCPAGGVFTLNRGELQLWKLDIHFLRRLLAEKFGCQGGMVARGNGLWYLGESNAAIHAFRRQVFFMERLRREDEGSLPIGTTQLLVVGELNPYYPESKFIDRVFLLKDLLVVKNREVIFDMDLVVRRLEAATPKPARKPKPVPKKSAKVLRADSIKALLRKHLRGACEHYWHKSADGYRCGEILPRPTLQHLAGQLKMEYNDDVNQTTVRSTIIDSDDQELKMLWEGCQREDFIRSFLKKR